MNVIFYQVECMIPTLVYNIIIRYHFSSGMSRFIIAAIVYHNKIVTKISLQLNATSIYRDGVSVLIMLTAKPEPM